MVTSGNFDGKMSKQMSAYANPQGGLANCYPKAESEVGWFCLVIQILDRIIIHANTLTTLLSLFGQPIRRPSLRSTQPVVCTSEILIPGSRGLPERMPYINGMFYLFIYSFI
jgi:hypothetical protein